MSPRVATLPPTEPAMWRKLLAAAHPDSDKGSHELYIWATAVREAILAGQASISPPKSPQSTSTGSPDAVPFDTFFDFDELTERAYTLADYVEPIYGDLLRILKNCEEEHFGRFEQQQRRGASYKQLAAIGHTVGMSKDQRIRWYRIAEEIPLSMRHAGYILSKLKGGEYG